MQLNLVAVCMIVKQEEKQFRWVCKFWTARKQRMTYTHNIRNCACKWSFC